MAPAVDGPFDYRPCGAVQIARAGVVAQPAPHGEYVILGGGGEAGKVGKALEEALVIRHDCGDLRLLQHDFRQPDPVRVARALPGKIVTAKRLLPFGHTLGEGLHCGSG